MAYTGMLVDCRKCPSLLHQQEVSGQQCPMQEQHKQSVSQSHDQNQYSHGRTRHLKVSSSGSPHNSQDMNRHHFCQQMVLTLLSHCLMLLKMARTCPSRRLWEADQFGQGLVLPTWKIMSQTFMHRGYMFFSLMV